MRIKFHFRWIPFLAMLVVIAIGVTLGQWQIRRAVEKETIAQRMQARNAEPPSQLGATTEQFSASAYQRVVVVGEFLTEWPIYMDNRPLHGRAGLYVLMPLKISGTDTHVLVMRGWIPRGVGARTSLPPLETPAGEIAIEGRLRARPGQLLELGEAEPLRPGALVQNLDPAQFGAVSNLKVHPFLVEQVNDTADGLVRDWPDPSYGADKHRGYAFQWFGLAAAAFLFFVVTGFRRGTR